MKPQRKKTRLQERTWVFACIDNFETILFEYLWMLSFVEEDEVDETSPEDSEGIDEDTSDGKEFWDNFFWTASNC